MRKSPSAGMRLCAWCKKVVIIGSGAKRKEIPLEESGFTVAQFKSHGLCTVCSGPLKEEAAAMKRKTVRTIKTNPPLWAAAKKIWARAVEAVMESYRLNSPKKGGGKRPMDFYVVVADVYRKMGGRVKRKSRGNPSDSEWRAVVDLFTEFHEYLPDTVTVASIPRKSMPTLVLNVGELISVTYRSDKWNKNGIAVDYVHKFSKPLPVLVSDADGNLYVVGGGYKITADGIVG